MADIGGYLNSLIQEDDPENISVSRHYDGFPEDNKALTQEEIDNIYKEGYIINIITSIPSNNWIYDFKEWQYEEGWSEEMPESEDHRTAIYWDDTMSGYQNHRHLEKENIVEFFAYNYNHNNNVTTVLNREKIISYFENRLSELDPEDETYNLLIRLKNYIEEIEENSQGEYKYDIYSNWYALQQVSETSISLSRVYIIDDEDQNDNDKPKNASLDNLRLNDNGLWFVTFSGHDEEE